MARTTKQKIESKVAREVGRLIDRSHKSRQDIADESNFPNANILSMIRAGNGKMPIERAADFARAVETDEGKFLKLVLSEYMPTVLQAFSSLEGVVIDEEEEAFIQLFRKARAKRKAQLIKKVTDKSKGNAHAVKSAEGLLLSITDDTDKRRALNKAITDCLTPGVFLEDSPLHGIL